MAATSPRRLRDHTPAHAPLLGQKDQSPSRSIHVPGRDQGRLPPQLNTVPFQQVLDRIRAEYMEMPGMRLKIAQVQRLFGVEQSMCAKILDALVDAEFLCLKPDGSYVRLTE